MKENPDSSDKFEIRQDLWNETPCLKCFDTYCCRNLPLTPLRLTSQSDFINLIQSSCYNDVFPVLKKSGEWNFYLERDCSFLEKAEGKCSIHNASHQSLICKSYNAHNCWYIGAFSTESYTTMIRFNTDMIIWFEKKYKLIENRFDVEIDWEELCRSAHDYRCNSIEFNKSTFEPWTSLKLSFKKSRTDQFLFFPPYKRPENRNHFELLSFRLGFPGVYLAVSDSCWAFLVRTDLNQSRLNLIRQEYYPAIGHDDGAYSFDRVKKENNPYSKTGDQWIILQRSDLEVLKSLTIIDTSGRVQKIPSSSDILNALRTKCPNLTA